MADSALHGILTRSIFPIQLGKTASDTLQEFIDIDVTTDDLVAILNRNPMYKQIFAAFVMQKTSKVAKEEKDEKDAKDQKDKKKQSPTHRLINLLGMIGSRNFIIALRIHRAVTGQFPALETKDKKGFIASDYLRTALDLEDLFLRNKFAYSESVYASGVLFDWLRFIACQRQDYKKSLENYFAETEKRARRYALLAHCLAERAPQFGFHKLAAPAAMLTQIGKLHMALAYPNWPEFEEQMSKLKLPAIARLVREREVFGVSQEEPSAFGLNFFSVFKSIEPSVRFYREPYFLKEVDPLLYRLAIFLELVDSLGRSWTLPQNENDPLILEAKRPWHSDLPIAPKEWIEALRIAMNAR